MLKQLLHIDLRRFIVQVCMYVLRRTKKNGESDYKKCLKVAYTYLNRINK